MFVAVLKPWSEVLLSLQCSSKKSQASFPTPPSASARPDQFSQHLTKQIYPREEFFQHAGKKKSGNACGLWGLSFIGKIFL